MTQGLQTKKSRDKTQQRSSSHNPGERTARTHIVSSAKKMDLVGMAVRKRPLIRLSERTEAEAQWQVGSTCGNINPRRNRK